MKIDYADLERKAKAAKALELPGYEATYPGSVRGVALAELYKKLTPDVALRLLEIISIAKANLGIRSDAGARRVLNEIAKIEGDGQDER